MAILQQQDPLELKQLSSLVKNTKTTFVTIGCHRNCVSTYTTKERLNRHRKQESSAAESDPSQPPIKQRRSTVQGFSFKGQCIFCGESCTIEKLKKHPDRWKRRCCAELHMQVQCLEPKKSPNVVHQKPTVSQAFKVLITCKAQLRPHLKTKTVPAKLVTTKQFLVPLPSPPPQGI